MPAVRSPARPDELDRVYLLPRKHGIGVERRQRYARARSSYRRAPPAPSLLAWSFACTAPPMAIERRRPRGGRSATVTEAASTPAAPLKVAGLQPSMSRKGMSVRQRGDGKLFSSLRQNLAQHERLADLDETGRKLFDYIEVLHNRDRLHGSLGYRTPVGRDRLTNA